jgi:hypothetical protein
MFRDPRVAISIVNQNNQYLMLIHELLNLFHRPLLIE